MSRTDKDLPLWARAQWWEPWHSSCVNRYVYPKTGWKQPDGSECDLPPTPVITQNPKPVTSCHWSPEWDRRHYPNPPHHFVTASWHRPERQASRIDCLNAAKEYRATGEVDTIPTVRQARHCAAWLWC